MVMGDDGDLERREGRPDGSSLIHAWGWQKEDVCLESRPSESTIQVANNEH